MPTLEERLEALAADVGRLRKGTRDTEFDWHVDRIAVALEEILESFELRADSLVKAGFTAEQALRYVDKHALRRKRMLGAGERELRLSSLL